MIRYSFSYAGISYFMWGKIGKRIVARVFKWLVIEAGGEMYDIKEWEGFRFPGAQLRF